MKDNEEECMLPFKEKPVGSKLHSGAIRFGLFITG